jgi:HEAT repeat protein
LTGSNKPLAQSAASLLGRLDDVNAAEPLIAALRDSEVGKAASNSLKGMTDPAIVAHLIAAMKSEKAEVRSLVAAILGGKPDKESILTLVETLSHDRAWEVRQTAARSLKALGWTPGNDRDSSYLALALDDGSTLRAMGAPIIDLLLRELRTGAFGRKVTAARTLGAIRDPRAVEVLIEKVKDEGETEACRIAAVDALGKIRYFDSIIPLFEVALGHNRRLGDASLTAIEAISSNWQKHPFVAARLAVLMQQFGDSDPGVRARAAAVLGQLRQSGAARQLALLLSDSDYGVREAAKSALSKIGAGADVEVLKITLLDLGSPVQIAALQALEATKRLSVQIHTGRAHLATQGTMGMVHYSESPMLIARESSPRRPPNQVSAYYPLEVEKGLWYPLVAYVFRQDAASDVEAEIRGQLARIRAQMRQITTKSKIALEQGSAVTVIPKLPGFVFNPPRLKVALYEDYQRFDFRFRAESADWDRSANGTLTFRVNGVIVAIVALSVFVTTAPSPSNPARTTVSMFRTIFASYSHDDTRIVERVERVSRLLGVEYLRDTTSLKSGEIWENRLLELIRKADVFQLFWSRKAAMSAWVKRELNYAVELQRRDFIWPVYWEEPLPPVPKSIRHLHFFFEPDLASEGTPPSR